jgi:polyhydroxyalkanoate synthesis repressor PhaR
LAEQIVIKKYSNRRLYDTIHKKYATLEEISNLIREGNEIKVLDSQTGEDITKVILIQAILESEKNKVDILPTAFLHMLIKYGNKIARDFFENYFLMMFQPYLSFQESMKKNLRWWQEMGWFPPRFPLPSTAKNPFEAFREESGKHAEGEKNPEPSEPFPSSLMEIELLRERVKELEEKIKSMDKPRKSGRKEKGAE